MRKGIAGVAIPFLWLGDLSLARKIYRFLRGAFWCLQLFIILNEGRIPPDALKLLKLLELALLAVFREVELAEMVGERMEADAVSDVTNTNDQERE